MPKRGQTQNWRIKFRYPGTKVPVRDEDGCPTGEYSIDTSRPINGSRPFGNQESAEEFAETIVLNKGTAELYYVDPYGPRSQSHWRLIRRYPE